MRLGYSWCPIRSCAPPAWGFLAVCLMAGASAEGHDLFFRSAQYVFAPGGTVTVDVLSGTFSKSENAIERDRLADLALLSPSGRHALDRTQWTEGEPKSTVRVTVAEAGTHVLGAAVKPRMLELSGKAFGAYLKEEGLDDALAARVAQGRVEEPSRERYSKYLKAILQVGEVRSGTHVTPLGHAAEIVPEQNPYDLRPGDQLTVRCLVDGKAWAGKAVFAGGRRGTTDRRLPPQRLVTDGAGRATVQITAAGVWYVKLVALSEVTGDPAANYESKWATLSFAIGTSAAPAR